MLLDSNMHMHSATTDVVDTRRKIAPKEVLGSVPGRCSALPVRC
jgi:hypothetical protein